MGINGNTALTTTNGPVELDTYGSAEELRSFAKRIRIMLPNGDKISDDEALAGAQFAKMTGLDPFQKQFWIVPGKGVQLNTLTERKRAGHYTCRFRMLTDAEREWHEIQPGDSAVICEGTRTADLLECRKLDIPYINPMGLGIVRKEEKGKRSAPTGKSWGWVAEKRAQTDLARQMGEPATADEIIAAAEAEGIQVSRPDAPYLTTEQAQAAVDQAHNLATANAKPIEQKRAELAARQAARRAAEAAFDDPPVEAQYRQVTTPTDALQDFPEPPEYDADADFGDMPSASGDLTQERADVMQEAEAIRDGLLCNQRQSWTVQITDPQINGVRATLHKLCDQPRDRHAILNFLTGVPDYSELSMGAAAAIMDWGTVKGEINPETGKAPWLPTEQAQRDVTVILEALRIQACQNALPGIEA